MIVVIFLFFSVTLQSCDKLPDEILAVILSSPDIQKLNKIIELQRKINRWAFDIAKPIKDQNNPQEIYNAIFPCSNFLIIQKTIYQKKNAIYQKIRQNLTNLLISIVPQGICFFLLPKTTRNELFEKSIKPAQDVLASSVIQIISNVFDLTDSNQQSITIVNSTPAIQKIDISKIDYTRIRYFYLQQFDKKNPYKVDNSIEFFLYHFMINVMKRLQHRIVVSFRTQEYKDYFSKFFQVFEYICLLDSVDLSLPAVSIEGNLAQFILQRFSGPNGIGNAKHYPRELLSEKLQAKLNFCCNQKPLLGSNSEYKFIIESFVDFYLFGNSDIKQELIKELSENKIEKENLKGNTIVGRIDKFFLQYPAIKKILIIGHKVLYIVLLFFSCIYIKIFLCKNKFFSC